MRIVVTGAGGFVGGRLVPRLEAAGHTVFPSDREVDVSDPDSVVTELLRARPDALIHLAAQSSVAASWADPSSAFRINFLGARSVIGALEQHFPKARLLLVGSGDEYAPTAPGNPPRREGDELEPRSPYARSKAAAELLAGFAVSRGLDVVCVRPFNHTGAGQGPQFVASDFARQIASIAAGQSEPEMRVGNLESVRDFLHVEDVLDAYVGLLDESVPADVYNVASGVGTSIRSMLDTLCELAGVSPRVQVDPERFRPTDSLVGDASRLRKATGWAPRIPVRDMLEELLGFWRDRLETDADSGA